MFAWFSRERALVTFASPYLLKNELEWPVTLAGTSEYSGSAWEP